MRGALRREELIGAEDAGTLDRLLADEEGLHAITTIKRQPRDFSYQQLLAEIERGQRLCALFALSQRIIATLDLSAESVRYCASLVEYYTVYKLKRMDREPVQLYLLCFIHDCYQRLNDNLLAAFCSQVRRYLVDDETFAQRADLLPQHGLEGAGRPIREQLEELRTLIDERFESVNRRILAGENAFVRVQDGRTFWERAVRSEEPLPSEPFFDMVERVDIDSPVLRHNVQRVLDRGEAYHQLRRSIAYAHRGRFRARSQHEQEIWNECSRLVGNAVVYYNALILSEVLAELESRGEPVSAEILKRLSPVAWQHINFYGRYQFDADPHFTPIDFARLRRQLSSEEVSRLYASTDR